MKRVTYVACCAAVLTLHVHAQESEVIEEIVVRAAPLDRSADEMTQSATVLTGDELLRKAQQTIGETLANELGISASSFGPAASRPIIRAQGGPRVSVREDGVSALDVSDVSPDHAITIEPLLAERIEVIRGPATLLYGSAAAGGVVNVIDRRVPESVDAPSAALESRYESASNERAIVGRADGGLQRFAWHVDGFARDSNDIEIPGFATADSSQRPVDERSDRLTNSFVNSHGYAIGGSYVADAGFLGAAVSRYENQYGLPGPPEAGAPAGSGPHIELAQTRIDLRGAREFAGVLESIEVRGGHNDYHHTEFEADGAPGTRFENDAWEGQVQAVHAPVDGWRGAFGVQMGGRDFAAVGEEAFVPPTQTQSRALFVIEEHEAGVLRVELAGRFETLRHSPRGAVRDFDGQAMSVAAGLVWDFAPTYDFSANVSATERLPAAEELYSQGAHLASGLYEVGLLAQGLGVDEETAVNLDMAIHHHEEAWSWQLSLFYNAIANYIYLRQTDAVQEDLPVAQYVQDDAEFYGYEAEAIVPLFPTLASSLDLRLFTDYVRGRASSDDLPRIPPWRGGAQLRYESNGWFAGLGAVYHARQDDVSSFATDSFTLLNADLTYEFEGAGPVAWQVFANASNLLDEDARRSTSFRAPYVPLMGRSVRIGVRAMINR